MADRTRMSNVDTAWLRMDAPNNLMIITGVMIFSEPIELPRLRQVLETRLLRYPRFRQRVETDPSGAYWVDDPFFDLSSHVHRVSLPGQGGKEELQQFVADQVSQQLDSNKPLWQMQLVENFEGGTAVVIRIHHCIADGISLIGVMLTLTDPTLDGVPAPAKSSHEPTHRNFWKRISQPVSSAMSSTMKVSSQVWSGYLSLLADPAKIFDYARLATTIASQAAELAMMPNDSVTRLKGKAGVAKRVAWTEPLSLPEVKTLGRALDASVNDLLLSMVAGAIRDYLAEHGDPVEDVEIRAMVPVNLRPKGEEHKLGNHFGLVPLVLPIGIADPIDRVFEVRRRMEELKGSYQAALSMGVLGLAGICPKPVQKQILELFAKKATAVMTNVPGPTLPLYVAGAPLKQMMFWVPSSGDIGLGVSILSYNGTVLFGLIADQRFVPDPDHVVGYFVPEFEKLVTDLLADATRARGETDMVQPALALLANARGLPVPTYEKPERPAPKKRAEKKAASTKKPRVAAASPKPPAKRNSRTTKTAAPSPAPPPKAPAGFRKKTSAFGKLRDSD